MVLNAFALLISKPVHEESVLQMNHENRPGHQAHDSERRDSGQQPYDQPKSAKEFGADDEKSHGRGHSHMREGPHRAVETVAAKPAQHFLASMRQEHYSEDQPQNRKAHIAARVHQPL